MLMNTCSVGRDFSSLAAKIYVIQTIKIYLIYIIPTIEELSSVKMKYTNNKLVSTE